MAKKELDLINPPEAKVKLTKEAMLKAIKEYGSQEDKEWFKKICHEQKTTKKNNLRSGAEIVALDIREVRNAWIERFYPDAFKKDKKKKPSFFEELDKL